MAIESGSIYWDNYANNGDAGWFGIVVKGYYALPTATPSLFLIPMTLPTYVEFAFNGPLAFSVTIAGNYGVPSNAAAVMCDVYFTANANDHQVLTIYSTTRANLIYRYFLLANHMPHKPCG